MASVTISGVYLAPIDDFTAQIVLNAALSLSEGDELRGELRRYAGGRIRLVTRPGSGRAVKVSVNHAARLTRELLASWKGRTLLLRDGRGRLVFGAFLALSADENQGLPYCDLSFDFTEITTSVEV